LHQQIKNKLNNMEKKPFICGGYTQQDWDIINGSNFDIEFYNDYCNTPMEKQNMLQE